jgi:hypothetical protein
LERRINDKLIVVDKHNGVPFVILVDLKHDKAFLLEGEEVQALREVLAGLEEQDDGGGTSE